MTLTYRPGAVGRLRDLLDRMPLNPGEPHSRHIEHDRAAKVLGLAHALTARTPRNVLRVLADEITRGGTR